MNSLMKGKIPQPCCIDLNIDTRGKKHVSPPNPSLYLIYPEKQLSLVVRDTDWNTTLPGSGGLPLPVAGVVKMGKSFNFPVPRVLYLKSGVITYLLLVFARKPQ